VAVDSGSVDAATHQRVIVSSRGVRCSESTSHLAGTLFGMAVENDKPGSFVVASHGQRQKEGINSLLDRVADEFAEKALGALNPAKGNSYKGLVLFTPEATASLLVGNLVSMMNSSVIRRGKSPLADKLHSAVAASGFTLIDDNTQQGGFASYSFDREGMPKKPFTLVKNGVFHAVPYNHYEALAANHGDGSTGHAAGGVESSPSVGTARLILEPGTQYVASILEDAGTTVIVTRFSGSTDAVTGEFSGVVKAGFVHENGERRPVSEILIAGNLLQVFENIQALSFETENVHSRTVMPYVLADGISVTAG